MATSADSNAAAFGRIRAVLSAVTPRTLALPEFARASVLVPILHRPAGPTVLFTRRTETMSSHKGQIAFPGGRADEGEDAESAALREASEEVGLEPSRVEVAGRLDDELSVSRYVVTPVVGIVHRPPALFAPHAAEVREAFEVPLARLSDRSFLREEIWDVSRMPPGAPVEAMTRLRAEELDEHGRYRVYFFDGGPDREIWGLTARILKRLLDVAFGAGPA